MFERFKRPLEDKEKKALSNLLSSLKRKKRDAYSRAFVVSFPIACILAVLTARASNAPWQVIVLFWLLIGTLIASWVALEERKKYVKQVKSVEQAINKGEAEVVRIKSKEMVEFKEIEDEGAGYAFQVDEEHILFISGQDYYPSKKFPNDDFEFIYIYDSAGNLVDLLIKNYGDKLTPIRDISSDTKKKLAFPEHLEVRKGRLTDLEQILSDKQ